MTRRTLLFSTPLLALRAQTTPLTARQVIERIQKNVGVPWRETTVDTFKAGKPDAAVTGIATSFMGTLDALQKAHAKGLNLLIVHEPTFYNHEDKTADLTGSVYDAKINFIAQNNMVVFRFHDHWHARRPDGIQTGMVAALAWEKMRSPDNPRLFAMPGHETLRGLAQKIKERMKIRTMRVIGDPALNVTGVALNPGYNDLRGVMRALERAEVDVLVIGESREWEGIEYAQDAVAAGKKKGLIILGHEPSEEEGMRECAKWIKTFVTEVPVEFVPGGEPFWAP